MMRVGAEEERDLLVRRRASPSPPLAIAIADDSPAPVPALLDRRRQWNVPAELDVVVDELSGFGRCDARVLFHRVAECAEVARVRVRKAHMEIVAKARLVDYRITASIHHHLAVGADLLAQHRCVARRPVPDDEVAQDADRVAAVDAVPPPQASEMPTSLSELVVRHG